MGEIFENIGKKYWWLNEESRSILNRGYLLRGEEPEDAVDRISTSLSKWYDGFKGKPKEYYKQVFSEIVEKGWMSLSSPIWANEGTSRGFSISCVTEDTWINTEKGAKQAKDIVIGDKLLTHKNRFRPVTNIIPTKDRGDIWKLKVCTRTSELQLTGDHLVLTNLGWVRVDELDTNKHLVAVNGKLEYTTSNYTLDLTKYVDYDFMVEDNLIKKISTCKDEKRKLRLNKTGNIISFYAQPYASINFTPELAWAFGIWFAEGNIMGGKSKPNGIKITMHEKELPIVEKWVNIMKDHFNLNGNTWLQTHKKDPDGKGNTWSNASINSVVIGNYFNSFGRGCKVKQIPEYILNLPKEYLEQFLIGMLQGDGSLRKDGTYKLTLSNPILILQVYQIGLKLGWDMSLQMNDRVNYHNNGIIKKHPVYTIVFRDYSSKPNKINLNKASILSGVKFSDGLCYCPIKELTKTNVITNVYDFTVEEDHSFSACGIILHNCFGCHIEDNIKAIANKLSEVILQTKHGAGTSAYFGKLRGRGAPITNNGFSSGAVSFMELFNTTMNVVSQGSTRRGSFAAYLDIDHPDIEEFLTIKDIGSPIQNLFYGVCVPDWWMKTMINEEGTYDPEVVKSYRKIWSKVLESRQFKGLPYIFFTDNVNKNKPEIYKKLDKHISHSNLCFSGDTRVKFWHDKEDGIERLVSFSNLYEIYEDLKGTDKFNIYTYVYNYETSKFEKSRIKKVFKNDETTHFCHIYIKGISKEDFIRCTPDHQFILVDGTKKQGQDLVSGDQLLNYQGNEVIVDYVDNVINYVPEPVYCLEVDNENHNFMVSLQHIDIQVVNCNEISQPDSEDESFICCLSSVNLELFDEWYNLVDKETGISVVGYAHMILDAVLSGYIEKLEKYGDESMKPALKSAKLNRPTGMGVLGYHSYLQKIGRSFEDMYNIGLNKKIFGYIQQETDKMSEELGEVYGYAPIFEGLEGIKKERNVVKMAIAPTTSSSAILGQVSPGIEPYSSNYYKVNLAKGNFIRKNKYLDEILNEKLKNGIIDSKEKLEEIWQGIMLNQGSVQHLPDSILSEEEKSIFKTFKEINQHSIILQAAERQKYIDQSQSLNINIPPSTPPKEVNKLIIEAWKMGVKTLYYQRSQSVSKELLSNITNCINCEG